MIRKIVAVLTSWMIIFGFVVFIVNETPNSIAGTITVDDSGGANFLTIQDGINAANPGDTVFVYSGTYTENVYVYKTINLTGEDKNTTIVDANSSGHGIYVSTDYVNISGFTVKNSASGSGGYGGIFIHNSTNCSVLENIADENQIGIYFWSSSNNTVTNNSISNNLVGIDARYRSDNIIIERNEFFDNEHGISVYSSSNHQINHNNVSGGVRSIEVINSSVISIIDHNLSNNSGIYSESSADIEISNNVITNSGYSAIQIMSSSNISILNNRIKDGDKYGIYLDSSSNSTVLYNNVSSHYESGIILLSSSNHNISYNEMLDNGVGISMVGSFNSSLYCNELLNNWEGVYIGGSSYIQITENEVILSGYYGIELSGISHNNTLYHNNFWYNKKEYDGSQASEAIKGDNRWDNGYPNGGNFWSDYDGYDKFNGPNQDILGGDGIGDSPYLLEHTGTPDRYPLMEPVPDILPPRILLISPDNNSIIRPGILLDYQVNEGNPDSSHFSVDGGFEQSFLYPYDIPTSGWGEGLHTVKIEAKDKNDNLATNTAYFIIDSTKPVITLRSPENNTEFKDGRIIDLFITDTNLAEVIYSINGQSNLTFSSPFDIPTDGWSEGNYTVYINAKDMAGNENSKWFLFTIDSTRPEIADVTSNPSPSKINGPMNITAHVSDQGQISDAWVEITDPNGGIFGNFSLTYDPETERYYKNQTYDLVGTYQFVIWIGDISRNWNSSADEFVVSTTPDIPNDLTALAGDSFVYLTWTAPVLNNELPITNYRIYRGETVQSESFLVEVGNVTSYNDTTVINGFDYFYRVTANNAVGEGPKSEEVVASPKIRSDTDQSQDLLGFWIFLQILAVVLGLIILFLLLRKREGSIQNLQEMDAIFPRLEIIECPWCEYGMEVTEELKPMIVNCPNCGREIDMNW